MEKFTETVQHTFLEYLASGFELSFMVAIDFTGIRSYTTTADNPKNFCLNIYNVVVSFLLL